MPLFPAIGAAIKIGGKALGAIVSKAKKKRAEKKLARAEKRAAEKELDFGAVAAKFGIAKEPGNRIGSLTENVDKAIKSLENKVVPIKADKAKAGGFSFGVKEIVILVVAVFGLFFLLRKRK
jgi:hypothetical protein